MGKPSITNIRPPSSTLVWTPPKTSWDLNTLADQGDSNFAWNSTPDSGSTGDSTGSFDQKTDQLNYISLGLTEADVDHYHYVFLGVNGGENETVYGVLGAGGIIATGNGMDTVVGGNHEDLIFSGNGKDIVSGGAGDDIIFGENGNDTLYGDHGAPPPSNLSATLDTALGDDQISGGNGDDTIYGDNGDHTTGGPDASDATHGNDTIYGGDGNDTIYGEHGNDIIYGDAGNDTIVGGTDRGTFNITVGGDTTVTQDGNPVFVWDHDPGSFTETGTPGPGDQPNQLRHEGVWVDGSNHIHQVFSFTAADPAPPGGTTDYTIAWYDGTHLDGDGDPSPNVLHVTLTQGDKYFFSFYDSEGGQVDVFSGNITPLDPNSGPGKINPISNQGYADEASYTVTGGGESEVTFTPGDTLTGGAGDDTFVWGKGDGVDLVMDFDQGNTGSFDAVNEHDSLTLHLDTGWSVHTTNDAGTGDLIVYFQDATNATVANSAIELAGITDASAISIVNTVANDWQIVGV